MITTHATSADGTTLSLVSEGTGPAVVVVGGAINRKEDWLELVEALAADGFTAVSYDRRGRGGSGDTRPYAVEREVEDLAAVVGLVADGAPAGVHTVSSGGAVAYRAVRAGVPVRSLTAFETPWRVAGAVTPPDDYTDHLQQLYDADAREEMLAYFMTVGVGQPPEAVEQMRGAPFWPGLVEVAHTTLYDGLQLGGGTCALPTDLLAGVDLPTLCLASTGSAPWLRDAARVASETVPGASYDVLEGGFHSVPVPVLAPAVAAFHRAHADAG